MGKGMFDGVSRTVRKDSPEDKAIQEGKKLVQNKAEHGPLQVLYDVPTSKGGSSNSGRLAKELLSDRKRKDFVDLFFVRMPGVPIGDLDRGAVETIGSSATKKFPYSIDSFATH